DGAGGHDPAAGGAADPAGLGRPARAERGDADRRRGRRAAAARRGGRDRAPQPARHARLLERPGEDGGGVPGRLVPQRRPGRDGRGRLPVGGRPEEGHDQDRRRERGQPRGRGGDLPASGGGGGGRVRGAGREVDRGGEGGGGAARGREPHRRGTGGFPAGAAGAVQDAQARPVRRVS